MFSGLTPGLTEVEHIFDTDPVPVPDTAHRGTAANHGNMRQRLLSRPLPKSAAVETTRGALAMEATMGILLALVACVPFI
jgi:hypothetical protein